MQVSKPIAIRSFLPVTKGVTGSIATNPVTAMTTAVNRLGATVEDIGKILVGQMQLATPVQRDANADQLRRDKKTEDDIEKNRISKKDLDKGANEEKPEPPKMGWLERLLAPFKWLAISALQWFVLDFLSDPKNKQTIKTGLKIIKAWLGTVFKVLTTGVNLIMEAFGEKNILMGALKLVGGLGALWLADRILKPWKLIGDAARLTRFLTKGMKKNTVKSQKQLHKQLVRRRAANIKRIRQMRKLKAVAGKGLRAGGKFLRGGGLSVLAGGAAFAGRLAKGDSMQVAVGAGAGATIGGLAMSALLTPILGPFGPIVGQLLGSFLGEKVGAFIGDAITPILEPIKNYFVKIAFPVFKSFVMPVINPMIELFRDGVLPVLQMIGDALKPVLDGAVKKINEIINSDFVQGAIQRLVNLIEGAKNIMQGGRDQLGRLMNVFGAESAEDTAARELREAQQAEINKNKQIQKAKEKLAELQAIQTEHGPSYKPFPWRYTIAERIEFEEQNIQELQQELETKVAQNIADKTAQLEEVKQRPQAPPGGAPKGSRFFPLPKGHFDGQIYQYHRTHESSSRAAHQGVDLVEKYPFGPNPAIDVVAVVGGEAITDRYVPNLDYLAGIMIKGDDGYDQRYLHMIPSIAPGDRVEAGQVIGKLVDMRRVGRSIDDTHLHFEVYPRGKGGDLSPHVTYPKLFGTPRQHQNTIVNATEGPDGGVPHTRIPVGDINTEKPNTRIPQKPKRKKPTSQAVILQPAIRRMSTSGGGNNVQFSSPSASIR